MCDDASSRRWTARGVPRRPGELPGHRIADAASIGFVLARLRGAKDAGLGAS